MSKENTTSDIEFDVLAHVLSQSDSPTPYFIVYKNGEVVYSLDDKNADIGAILNTDVELSVDSIEYTAKPSKDDIQNGRANGIKSINDMMCSPESVRTLKIWELAQTISKGVTVQPGICLGKRKKEYWTQQQLWFLDLDNDDALKKKGFPFVSPRTILKRLLKYGFTPVMVYPSFSCRKLETANRGGLYEKPGHLLKFRVVVLNNEVITDISQAEAIGNTLLSIVPEADPQTTEPQRMFFGSREVACFGNIKL